MFTECIVKLKLFKIKMWTHDNRMDHTKYLFLPTFWVLFVKLKERQIHGYIVLEVSKEGKSTLGILS